MAGTEEVRNAIAGVIRSTMARSSVPLAENSAVTVTPLMVVAVAAVGMAEEAVVAAVEAAQMGAPRTILLRLRHPHIVPPTQTESPQDGQIEIGFRTSPITRATNPAIRQPLWGCASF